MNITGWVNACVGRLVRRAALVVLFSFSGHGQAEDLGEAYRDLFGAISSVKCNATIFGQDGPKDDGTRAPMQKIADVKYALSGGRFYYDYLQYDDNGAVNWSQLCTFDGKQTCDFFRSHDRSMSVYEGKVACPTMDGNNVMLEPFAFVNGERYQRPGFTLTLEELRNPKEWADLVQGALAVREETLDGRQCQVLEVKGGEFADPELGKFTMRVWMDKGLRYYPIQWQRIMATGRVIEQYNVIEIGFLDEKQVIPYPKVAERKRFDKEGTLMWSNRIVPSDVALNTKVDASLFTIDATLAKSIWDAATNTWIYPDPAAK